ncbi:MAG: two-component sensor histidine kinase [Alkaliphilus sp.]|nr:HAMP domain-containing protein [bacterium AH-315-K05]PHS34967.1 MAG: two-component sensor histidine kinase [Alkaliphilus sp.]
MKKSIAMKLFIGFLIFTLFIVSLSWVMFNLFFENYYLMRQKNLLLEYGSQFDSLYTGDVESVYEHIEKIAHSTGGDITVLSSSGEIRFTTSALQFVRQGNRASERNPRHSSDRSITMLRQNTFEQVLLGDKVIEIVTHPNFNVDFLVYSAMLSNGDILIISTTYAPISASIKSATDFHLFIALISITVGTIIAYAFSKKFTKPIIELNKITKRMADLNFDAKYLLTSDDEIGTLGKNINFLSKKLDSTITKLNLSNQILKKELQKEKQLDKMRKEFVSSVSHELKTPIALIQGYAEGLVDNIASDEETRNFYCEVIVDESKKMEKLVTDLLDLSVIESGNLALNIKSFDILELVEKVVNTLSPLLTKKRINVNISSDDKTQKSLGDATKIEQVLINFINNAISYSHSGSEILIKISNKNKATRIEIFNSHSEIPENELSKIWASFYKLDKARSRELGNTGLGLSIVKGILDAHNYPYGVFNSNNGVTFWFEAKNK